MRARLPVGLTRRRRIGAARDYYTARAAARLVHARGLYLVGRVVVFEDPVLSRERTDLAIRRGGGSRWLDAAGLGWTNPYDRRVWKYNVDLATDCCTQAFAPKWSVLPISSSSRLSPEVSDASPVT